MGWKDTEGPRSMLFLCMVSLNALICLILRPSMFLETTLPETNSVHLKMDGWKILSFWFWDGLCSGAMLLSGSVILKYDFLWCNTFTGFFLKKLEKVRACGVEPPVIFHPKDNGLVFDMGKFICRGPEEIVLGEVVSFFLEPGWANVNKDGDNNRWITVVKWWLSVDVWTITLGGMLYHHSYIAMTINSLKESLTCSEFLLVRFL